MNMFRALMDLDELYDSERQSLINKIKNAGKSYNFDKYSTAQLYRMWQRISAEISAKSAVVNKEPKHDLDLEFDASTEPEYCDCGERLSDAGFCLKCHDGEEDIREGIFDSKPSRSSWVSASGKPINLNQTPSNTTSQSSTTQNSPTTSKYVVTIVFHGGRLRALATDGVNPAAWVAFPNDLRQFEGQKYEVDQLIWNGKNYRVAGNIVEI